MSKARVTLITTVLNEQRALPRLLASILASRKLPDEVVFADAGSRDATIPLIEEFARTAPFEVKLIMAAGNRSKGRNEAIRAATHEVIACTDAGCDLDPGWLGMITAPLLSGRADVVSGGYACHGDTWYERTIGAVTVATWGIRADTFLPSARSVAFTKAAWTRVGGFPEGLDFAEDTAFALALRRDGRRFDFAPQASVRWRPRQGVRQVWLQLYSYARGDARAQVLGANYARLFFRYGIWSALTVACLLDTRTTWVWLVAFVPYWSVWSIAGWRAAHDVRAILVAPLVKLVADCGKMAGYFDGLRRRFGSD